MYFDIFRSQVLSLGFNEKKQLFNFYYFERVQSNGELEYAWRGVFLSPAIIARYENMTGKMIKRGTELMVSQSLFDEVTFSDSDGEEIFKVHNSEIKYDLEEESYD